MEEITLVKLSRFRFWKKDFEGFVESNVRMWGRERRIKDKLCVFRLRVQENGNIYMEYS